MGLSPQPGSAVGEPPALKGWLQKKELKAGSCPEGAWAGPGSSITPRTYMGGQVRVTVREMEPSWGQVMSEALEEPSGSGRQVVGRLKERRLWALWAPELVRLARCRGGGWNCHPGWNSCDRGSLYPIGRRPGSGWGSGGLRSLCELPVRARQDLGRPQRQGQV